MKARHYIISVLLIVLVFTGFEFLNFAALEKDMGIVHTSNGQKRQELQSATQSKKIFKYCFIATLFGTLIFMVYPYYASNKKEKKP